MHLAEKFVRKQADPELIGKYESIAHHADVANHLGAKQVHYDIVDTTRWGQVVEYVYEGKGDNNLWELARVTYEVGAGDSDIDYEPEWQAVRPIVKTTVVYEKIELTD